MIRRCSWFWWWELLASKDNKLRSSSSGWNSGARWKKESPRAQIRRQTMYFKFKMYKMQYVESGNQECNSGAGARKFPEACEGALYGSELTHDASKVIDQSTTPPSSSSALRALSLKNFSDNFLDYFCLTCIFSGASEGRSCSEQSQVNCETSISLV